MRRDRVVVKGDQTFEVYGSNVTGYFLEIWDHGGEESQRIDVAITDLAAALVELEVWTLDPKGGEIRPPVPPNPLQPTIRVQPR